MAYWVSVVLRLCRSLLAEAAPAAVPEVKAKPAEGRSLRARRSAPEPPKETETVLVNGIGGYLVSFLLTHQNSSSSPSPRRDSTRSARLWNH